MTELNGQTRWGQRKGWRRIVGANKDRVGIKARLEQLTTSPLASDETKERAHKLLDAIVDDRLSVSNHDAAFSLVRAHRSLFSKAGIKRLTNQNSGVSHAIFMACQGCENLRGLAVGAGSTHERNDMVMQIANAINVLSEVQTQLIGELDV